MSYLYTCTFIVTAFEQQPPIGRQALQAYVRNSLRQHRVLAWHDTLAMLALQLVKTVIEQVVGNVFAAKADVALHQRVKE